GPASTNRTRRWLLRGNASPCHCWPTRRWKLTAEPVAGVKLDGSIQKSCAAAGTTAKSRPQRIDNQLARNVTRAPLEDLRIQQNAGGASSLRPRHFYSLDVKLSCRCWASRR